MCKVVASLKYLRANYVAQCQQEGFFYEALSHLAGNPLCCFPFVVG